MRKFVVVLFLLLCACVATNERGFRKLLNLTVGKPEENIIMVWGAPHDVYNTGQYKIIKYSFNSSEYIQPYTQTYGNSYNGGYGYTNYHTNAYTVGGYTKYYNCDVSFFVKNGIIVNYTFMGNACKAPENMADKIRRGEY